MTWITPVAGVMTGWYLLLWCIGILGWKEARRRYVVKPHSPTASAETDAVEGVSILRPLKGLDPNIYENLETSFLQVYPKFEIIFAVADEGDQALAVVRELIAKYPHVDAKIITSEQVVGVNPKVNNLMKPYYAAGYDILWVLDSNVQTLPDTLARSVAALNRPSERRIGLVHHVPVVPTYETTAEVGTRIEQAFLNTNHAKMYIALNTLAIDSCVMGKSNMYRRSDVDRLTGTLRPTVLKPSLSPTAPEHTPMGFSVFGKFLAEDNMLASALWHELGLRHDLGSDVAVNSLGSMSFREYASRRARWIRVRKWMTFAATLLEPFSESVFVGVLVSLAVSYLTDGLVRAWIFFPAHMLSFLAIDLSVRNILIGEPLYGAEWWAFVRAWGMREVMAFPIWLFAMLGNEVDWRGRKYRILRNGETRRVENSGSRTIIGGRIRDLFFGRSEDMSPLLAAHPEGLRRH